MSQRDLKISGQLSRAGARRIYVAMRRVEVKGVRLGFQEVRESECHDREDLSGKGCCPKYCPVWGGYA